MSSSVFRPFRHTSCIVSLSLVTCLSEFGNSLQHDEATAERQLEIERSKKSGNADRVEALVGKINDFEGKIKELEQHMKDFFTRYNFNGVFSCLLIFVVFLSIVIGILILSFVPNVSLNLGYGY